ncbi:serine/threonine-protein kinase [Polyangium aurulentum]|uniref:serine/threonine-protein kinase n=1 Tax=Polyangium aurulentum TaxID=2567896 RepID=UPI0010AECA3A|nr:serine/threonine-protein kinase [Polyangium aurulentum]UQA55757.1 protein kinase [Polyangium aurulentum]
MTSAESSGIDPRIGALAGGKYKVLRLIGRGGMGSVYEAQNVAIGKRVALKFLRLGAGDAQVRARFHREARAVSAVESAHIVQIFDTGETEAGEPFLVMELLQGEDLATRLKRLGRMGVNDAVAMAAQALRGLRRAHAAGVVHRDLKPHNVFLVASEEGHGHVKIVDFGLSKVLGGIDELVPQASVSAHEALSRAGSPVGTPLYMSPEQIEALEDIDQRTDLWSMGAILFEALAGVAPFSEPTFARLVIAICHKDPPDLRKLVPGLPEPVARVVARAMTRDRQQRFQSADAFLTALAEAAPEVDKAQGPWSFRADASPPLAAATRTPLPVSSDSGASIPPGPTAPGDVDPPPRDNAPGAELKTYTQGGATLWLSASPAFSLWRGEVATPDRLRVETRDGGLFELRLEPVGVLRIGRAERVGDERNELVYPDVASRLAATLRHDGVRWWLLRRTECSVPVQVGARALARGEQAPLVHGIFVQVGGMRATMVDRRYVTPTVPAGTVDPTTGLLGRAGLEQEIASFLQRKRSGALILVRAQPSAAPATAAEYAPEALAAVAVHRAWPSLAVGLVEGTVALLAPGEAAEAAEKGRAAAALARDAVRGSRQFSCGYWTLSGDGIDAGREIELALHAMSAHAEGASGQGVAALRTSSPSARLASVPEVLGASTDARKTTTLLFAIEEQNALGGVGPHVISALEKELAAVVATHAGQSSLVAPLAPGVVAACVTKKVDAVAAGNAVQCDWHARPPVLDGKVELPRTLSWEILHGTDAQTRAGELSRECKDPHGVLSALSGGLPYPIAGRVHEAIAASSAIERVKMLFDVLEGTWRFIATVLLSAYFARRPAEGGEVAPGFDAMLELFRRNVTRDGFALGTWREIARTAAKAFDGRDDPIGALVRDVLGVKLSQNQTFETLSNLMQVERNSFAHGHYNEARATADLPEFEQMTRTLLRALRPLCAWTLVTVEKTEPDLYGELQTVEFIDHTGPFNTGTRRRLGLNSPVRLANVAYLARWREGLVLPLEPFMRRVAHEERFDLYWMDHLPRAGACQMSSAVGGPAIKVPCDVRRLPPLLRLLLDRTQGGG